MYLANFISKSGFTVLAVLIVVAFISTIIPIIAVIDSRYRPVIRDMKVINVEQQPNGVAFSLEFNKIRPCEILSLQWGDILGQPIPVITSPLSEKLSNRPLGKQISRRFFAPGLSDVGDIHLTIAHKCNPVFVTRTKTLP